MLRCFLVLFISLPFLAASQLPSRTIHHLKTGRLPDDSSHVYELPYPAGKKHLFVQGANSRFSHRAELSYDFKMREGQTVCAARGGRVTAAKEDSREGGLKPEYYDDGNHVIIEHTDGSTAWYWHLAPGSVAVEVGDTVSAGQRIGRSGNTGYSAFPHLHFQVTDAAGAEILVRFHTRRGYAYLRPGRWYRR